ncbi:MAG: hypothetical protein GQ532_14925, partial [Methylomarinum sp.]|nr:hypothetical protein [Methylomarinum sp.]
MEDYLGVEQIIISQLDTQLRRELKGNVLSVADLEGVEEQLQKTPAAQVIFFDDVPVNGDKGKSGP